MIKHCDWNGERFTFGAYWSRRPLAERLDGESYWRGKFVIVIEPPRIYRRPAALPWIMRGMCPTIWTGRSREITGIKFAIGVYILSPGGMEKKWRYQR
jgi:hypothetical protein